MTGKIKLNRIKLRAPQYRLPLSAITEWKPAKSETLTNKEYLQNKDSKHRLLPYKYS